MTPQQGFSENDDDDDDDDSSETDFDEDYDEAHGTPLEGWEKPPWQEGKHLQNTGQGRELLKVKSQHLFWSPLFRIFRCLRNQRNEFSFFSRSTASLNPMMSLVLPGTFVGSGISQGFSE